MPPSRPAPAAKLPAAAPTRRAHRSPRPLRSLKAKNAELAIAKEAEDKVRAVMEEVRSREEAKKPDLPKLFKERDELRASINEHRSAIRKIQNEFNAEKKEYYEYLKVRTPPHVGSARGGEDGTRVSVEATSVNAKNTPRKG